MHISVQIDQESTRLLLIVQKHFCFNYRHLHFVIGQNHRIELYCIDEIGVIANQSREPSFPNFIELFCE